MRKSIVQEFTPDTRLAKKLYVHSLKQRISEDVQLTSDRIFGNVII